MSIKAQLAKYRADQLMDVLARVTGWMPETLKVELTHCRPRDDGFPGHLTPDAARFYASTRICGQDHRVVGSGRMLEAALIELIIACIEHEHRTTQHHENHHKTMLGSIETFVKENP